MFLDEAVVGEIGRIGVVRLFNRYVFDGSLGITPVHQGDNPVLVAARIGGRVGT
jgi:hypothetical protein